MAGIATSRDRHALRAAPSARGPRPVGRLGHHVHTGPHLRRQQGVRPSSRRRGARRARRDRRARAGRDIPGHDCGQLAGRELGASGAGRDPRPARTGGSSTTGGRDPATAGGVWVEPGRPPDRVAGARLMTTAKSRPIFARLWARGAAAAESRGTAELRDCLLAEVTGRGIEVGPGSGTNFAPYPPTVASVVAVEPEPHLRALAAEAAARAPVPVTVVDGLAAALQTEDGAFDAAVVSLVLCSVPDQAAAVAELRRVLRPGGRLHVWEHVRAPTSGLARMQRTVDATVWPFLGGGCHTGRDTVGAI